MAGAQPLDRMLVYTRRRPPRLPFPPRDILSPDLRRSDLRSRVSPDRIYDPPHVSPSLRKYPPATYSSVYFRQLVHSRQNSYETFKTGLAALHL